LTGLVEFLLARIADDEENARFDLAWGAVLKRICSCSNAWPSGN